MQLYAPTLLILGVLLSSTSRASSDETPCFDLKKPSTILLKAAPAQFEADKDPSNFGTDPKTNNDWGEVSGVIAKPMSAIVDLLLDPKTIRNGGDTTVFVKDLAFPGFLKRVEQKIIVKPVFFITIEWTEDWGFSVKDGTLDKPKSVIVSYQKKEGTSHIKHFCGNMFLKSLTPKSTGIYLYEEVQADRRSAEDVQKGLQGTLRTLRQ